MVEDSAHCSGAGQGDAVVERGGAIKQELRPSIDATTDDVPGVAKGAGKAGEHCQTCDRKHRPNGVSDAVGNLFRGAIFG